MLENDSVEQALKAMSDEAAELYLHREVPELHEPPQPIDFLRSYVMPNQPVIIRGGVREWPAINKWTDEYLTERLGDAEVTVAVTPNGYADAPIGDRFVMPEERTMKFSEFISLLQPAAIEQRAGEVLYAQKQNSSFTDEFAELLPDAADHISWASEALGKRPDAINFWLGEARAITSMHKDHYENLYAVVRGSKTFILQPPTDLPCIPHRTYQPAKFEKTENGEFCIVDIRTREEKLAGLTKDADKVSNNNSSGKTDQEIKVNDENAISEESIMANLRKKLSEHFEENRLKEDFTESSETLKERGLIVPGDQSKIKEHLRAHVDPKLKAILCGSELLFPKTQYLIDSMGEMLSECTTQAGAPQPEQPSEQEDSFEFVEFSDSRVPWVAIDPLAPDLSRYPSYAQSHPVECTLYAGDVLYLPALWFHHVRQTNGTVAVNFWYDMEYDIKYNYFKLVERLVKLRRKADV